MTDEGDAIVRAATIAMLERLVKRLREKCERLEADNARLRQHHAQLWDYANAPEGPEAA